MQDKPQRGKSARPSAEEVPNAIQGCEAINKLLDNAHNTFDAITPYFAKLPTWTRKDRIEFLRRLYEAREAAYRLYNLIPHPPEEVTIAELGAVNPTSERLMALSKILTWLKRNRQNEALHIGSHSFDTETHIVTVHVGLDAVGIEIHHDMTRKAVIE